jgi:hypothetical protein
MLGEMLFYFLVTLVIVKVVFCFAWLAKWRVEKVASGRHGLEPVLSQSFIEMK